MKMKKVISVVLACACVFSFAACGSKSDSSKSDSAKSDKKEKLVMATNAEFPPFEYYDGDEVVGIDAEFAAAIADKLGMDLKIEDMAFDSIVPAVQSGKADIGAAGMTVTEDRATQVDFSDSYYTGVQVIIVTDDSDITGPDDLKGKKIGVQQGTTGDIYSTDDFGDDNVERFNKGMEAVQALQQGKIDAVIIDNQPAKTFVEENEGLKILDTSYVEEDYALAIKKGNDDLVKKVNDAIKELKEDGTFTKKDLNFKRDLFLMYYADYFYYYLFQSTDKWKMRKKILSELYQKVYFKELEAQIHKILATESKKYRKILLLKKPSVELFICQIIKQCQKRKDKK